jgi:hypothetical protein
LPGLLVIESGATAITLPVLRIVFLDGWADITPAKQTSDATATAIRIFMETSLRQYDCSMWLQIDHRVLSANPRKPGAQPDPIVRMSLRAAASDGPVRQCDEE